MQNMAARMFNLRLEYWGYLSREKNPVGRVTTPE
jgi:hypothetical protein